MTTNCAMVWTITVAMDVPRTPEHVLGDISAAFFSSLNFSLSFSDFGKTIPICNSLETKFEQSLHGGFKQTMYSYNGSVTTISFKIC